ncbi:MAG: DUF2029 domain-containing protein [Lachnospiraceae bacterium]|nr:DUF2029 domain-containing protein [Lachnospiraceae bacterium]
MIFPGGEGERKLLKEVLAGALLLLCLLSVGAGIRNALRFSQDFQYDAARALLLGMDPYEISQTPPFRPDVGADEKLDSFYGYFSSIDAPQKMEANQFPSLLMELFPLALMPFRLSVSLWLLCNLVFTALILFFLRKTFLNGISREMFSFLSLLMIAGTPWRNQLGVGQHTLFSFCFFLAAVWCSERGKQWGAGVLLAFSMFKYTLTLPLALYFVFRRRFKELAITAVIHLTATFAAMRLTGRPFFYLLIEPLRVSMALSGEGSLDIGSIIGGGALSVALTFLLLLILLILSVRMTRKDGAERLLFTLLLLCSLVMTYHRSYDFFVMTAAYSGIAELEEKSRSVKMGKPGKVFGVTPSMLYFILLAVLFFGLRLFSESPGIMIFSAVLYYGFLIYYTINALLRNSGKAEAGNG